MRVDGNILVLTNEANPVVRFVEDDGSSMEEQIA